VFEHADTVPHVTIGRQADLVIVAPATADLLARAATGRADDLLSNVLLTATCPVVYAPAMHTEMWLNAATRANVATLRSRGAVVVDPASGRLTGADSGPGRLPEAVELHAVAASILADPSIAPRAARRDLSGLRVAVSAGGTHEHLDPVRFIGNSSSGLMGWALARAAALRGATVTLVAANVTMPAPADLELVRVTSTADLAEAMEAAAKDADLVVMAAAPADYTPAAPSSTKLKKNGDQGLGLELVQTTDVLASLVEQRADPHQVLVGFAAETPAEGQDLVELGRAKLARKGCDLLVLNEVGHGRVFGRPTSEITIISAGTVQPPVAGSKDELAHRIWDEALAARRSKVK
jgi:phosphopantothenoylcysteine decarboxylase/phosphopantothenate--cysteine ligase